MEYKEEKELLAKLGGYVYKKEFHFGGPETSILYSRTKFTDNKIPEKVIYISDWDPKNDWNILMDIIVYVEKHYIKSHYGVNIFRQTCTLYYNGVYTNNTHDKKESTYYTLLKLAKSIFENEIH